MLRVIVLVVVIQILVLVILRKVTQIAIELRVVIQLVEVVLRLWKVTHGSTIHLNRKTDCGSCNHNTTSRKHSKGQTHINTHKHTTRDTSTMSTTDAT